MNHETQNIIIDPSLSGDQTARTMSPTISRPFLWGALAVAALVALFILFSTGCSDDDDDKADNKADDKAAEISQCKKMADSYESCLGWETMNTTLKAAKSECDKADFDKYDRCMFDCADLSIDCEVLTSCFDEC
jgi:hypothetical protein